MQQYKECMFPPYHHKNSSAMLPFQTCFLVIVVSAHIVSCISQQVIVVKGDFAEKTHNGRECCWGNVSNDE